MVDSDSRPGRADHGRSWTLRDRTRCARPVTRERGAGTLVVVGVLAVVTVLAMATALVAAYVGAAHRARSSADLVALSGATSVTQGGDACATARDLAKRNGVELITCTEVGDQIDFVVSVRVRVRVAHRVPGLPQAVDGLAHAGRLE